MDQSSIVRARRASSGVRYPTDLTDAEWERDQAAAAQAAKRGRKPGVDLREILNAIRYLARAGCGWRMLPHDSGRGRRCTGGSGASCVACCSAPSTMWR